jgi:hypothetical protein
MLLIAAVSIWCWSADLYGHGNCVYTREQCLEIVKLRRRGVCRPSQMSSDRAARDRVE